MIVNNAATVTGNLVDNPAKYCRLKNCTSTLLSLIRKRKKKEKTYHAIKYQSAKSLFMVTNSLFASLHLFVECDSLAKKREKKN